MCIFYIKDIIYKLCFVEAVVYCRCNTFPLPCYCYSTKNKAHEKCYHVRRILPVIVRLTVEFGVAAVAGVAEKNPALAAGQAMLVPARISYSHQETIVDLLPTALTHLVCLLTLDRRGSTHAASTTNNTASNSTASSTNLCIKTIFHLKEPLI